ncbi:MAG TPA: hypothetical protein VM284_06950 [Candidatus Limnocylindria bacterium]|nr:hypothetical protein [Candidatus Limnocylindria bacterium]
MDEQRNLPGEPGEGSHQPGIGDDPDSGDLRRLGEEGSPVGLRVGRDPANLGDEVPAEGDLSVPEPVIQPAEM